MKKEPSATEPESAPDSWQTKEVIDQARQDLQSRISDVTEAAKHTAQEVRAAATTTAAAARDGCQALRDDAAAHLVTYRHELERQIQQQPLKSVGLAALGGLILGLLLRR